MSLRYKRAIRSQRRSASFDGQVAADGVALRLDAEAAVVVGGNTEIGHEFGGGSHAVRPNNLMK